MAFIARVCLVLSVGLLSEYFVDAAVIRNESLFRLDIIHYNDFHARFEETTQTYPVCSTNDTSCLGGFARLYQEINTLFQEKPNALLLNAGDVFQGTYWYTLFKWEITQKFMNLLPNDAHTVGNHEFDDGISGLAPYLAALKAPVVVANIDTSEEPALKDLYKPHIVVERQGKKIGIIGLITTATAKSSNPEKVKFLDPIETVKNEAQKLTEDGVDIIVVLSHCGLNVDKEIAAKVGKNIDIIVGGHTHSLLWNGLAPEPVAGPYPIIVETESNPAHKVVVVTAAAHSKYLGNLTAYFDINGELQSFEGEPVYLNRSIAEDPKIKSILMPYMEDLHSIVNEVVGYTETDLLDEPCGSGECEIGNLVADAFLNTTKASNASNIPHVSFLLRNMIRGSIQKGNITRGSIINMLPFTNKVVTLVVTGKDLLEAFKICLQYSWTDKPFSGPHVPHVSGIKLTLNTTSKEAESASIYEDGQYKPLELEKDYQLTTLRFLQKGGNGFDVFKEHGRNVAEIGMDAEILEKYVLKNTPITPYLDSRLVMVQ